MTTKQEEFTQEIETEANVIIEASNQMLSNASNFESFNTSLGLFMELSSIAFNIV